MPDRQGSLLTMPLLVPASPLPSMVPFSSIPELEGVEELLDGVVGAVVGAVLGAVLGVVELLVPGAEVSLLLLLRQPVIRPSVRTMHKARIAIFFMDLPS